MWKDKKVEERGSESDCGDEREIEETSRAGNEMTERTRETGAGGEKDNRKSDRRIERERERGRSQRGS